MVRFLFVYIYIRGCQLDMACVLQTSMGLGLLQQMSWNSMALGSFLLASSNIPFSFHSFYILLDVCFLLFMRERESEREGIKLAGKGE